MPSTWRNAATGGILGRPPAHDPLRLYTYQEGKGPSVILLHGLGSSGADWPLQMAALCGQFRVIAPDLRGHGRSSLPLGRPTVRDYAADVRALLDELGLPRAHLVGLSLGGAVAQQIALDAPERVERLVLVNTAAKFEVYRPAMLLRGVHRLALMRLRSIEAMSAAIAGGLFPEPQQAELRAIATQRMARSNPHAYRMAIAALVRFDVRARLPEIRSPTLVVVGRNDHTVPMLARLYVAAHIPRARLAVIAKSGHATPLDQPETFNRLLLSFLSE